MRDDELRTAFENRSLPHKLWTHRAHLRVAFLYAATYRWDEALQRMRRGIQAYNAAHRRPDQPGTGYHETITCAFMALVLEALQLNGPYEDSADFLDHHPRLLGKSILETFYSAARLSTAEARDTFVEPDRAALPHVIDGATIVVGVTEEPRIESVRSLLAEFAQSLEFDLGFQQFESELRDLPGAYGPPAGRILMAYVDRSPAGCVALRACTARACEMKRLWVRPNHQGKGLGRQLALAIIRQAAAAGYEEMRLDTVPSMKSAIGLYRSLGFVNTEPYTHNPIPGALFMKLDLRRDAAARS